MRTNTITPVEVTPVAAPRKRRRPLRLSHVLLVAALLLTAAGFAYLWQTRTTIDVFVAAADIPAYRQLLERDVRRVALSSRDLPDTPIVDRDGLIGRYTVAPVAQDEPYTKALLGPVLPAAALDGLGVAALRAPTEVSIAGAVSRGDHVDLLLCPSVVAKDPRAATLSDVLVLDLRTVEGDGKALVVALSRQHQVLLRGRIGTSVVVAVRTRPYVRS